MLIQIITGDFVDPEAVIAVEVQSPIIEGSDWLVVVYLDGGAQISSGYDEAEEASEIRQNIAEQVNEALGG